MRFKLSPCLDRSASGIPVSLRTKSAWVRLAALALLIAGLQAAHAQMGPKVPDDVASSKIDIYAGYGYIHPFKSGIGGVFYQPTGAPNVTASLSYYFGQKLGAQIEGAYFNGNGPGNGPGHCAPSCEIGDPQYYHVEVGPVLRFPHDRIVPFVHILAGVSKVAGPQQQPLNFGGGLTGGGGADYVLPYFHNLFALRGQADFEYMFVNFGEGGPVYGDTGDVYAYKFSGGLVLRLGKEPLPQPVALACSVAPTSIYPGDPVTISGTASGLNPKKKATYLYTSTGGVVSMTGEGATLDTKGLAAGSYVVTGTVTQGPKAREMATCTSALTVKAFEPPTLSCSASPSTVNAGDTATITATGVSPQNRPLTYTYSASAGQISGTGASATLATAGVAPATILVACNVTDDLGQKATASTSVTILSIAPPPPKPESQQLCSVAFTRDTKRPMRVDNEAKACLDDIALALQRTTDAKLVIVGDHSPDEPVDHAAVRTLNVRAYLTKEKGVDPSRIELRTDGATDRSVDNYLLVPGAELPDMGTIVVDPATIKPQGLAYGIPGTHKGHHRHRHHHKK